MTDHPDTPLCGGPIDHTTGVCGWCKTRHIEGVDPVVDAIPNRCDIEWPDRPTKVVNPEVKVVPMRAMKVVCWRCGMSALLNSIQHNELFRVFDLPDSRINTQCTGCGAGIVIRQSALVTVANGTARPNAGNNRKARRLIDKIKGAR